MQITRSTNLNLRISPEVKDALKEAATLDHRSLNNMVEFLIIEHCKKIGVELKGKPKD